MHRWLLVLSLLIFPFISASAASFNCDKATTTNEKHICTNQELSDLDEAYAIRYKKMLKLFAYDKGKTKRDAVFALKERDARCSIVNCLKFWYVDRITQYDLAIAKIRAEELAGTRYPKIASLPGFSVAPHPVSLFKALNLRSFENNLSPLLSTDCNSYLSEFIEAWDFAKLDSSSYVFGHDGLRFSYTQRHGDKITIVSSNQDNLAPYEKTIDIAYSLKNNEWRASSNLIVDKPELCKTQAQNKWKRDVRYRRDASDSERVSVGEVDLGSLPVNQVGPVAVWDGSGWPPEKPYHKSKTPIYDGINGKRIGNLDIEVYSDSVEGSWVRVILVDDRGLKLARASVLSRDKYYPAMLIFKEKSGWFRLTKNDGAESPIWIHEQTTHPAFIDAYKDRKHLIETAEEG